MTTIQNEVTLAMVKVAYYKDILVFMGRWMHYLPNALAIATFPSTPMTGTKTIDDPRSETISMNVTFLSPIVVSKGGADHDGRPSLGQEKI